MTDETALLAAICAKREACNHATNIGLTVDELGDAAGAVYAAACEQYERDGDLQEITPSTLRSQIERRFGEGSMADSVMDFVASFPKDTSAINVVEEYRLVRLARVATELATNLATGQHGAATQELIEVYEKLKDGEHQEEENYRLGLSDFTKKSGQRIPIMPERLNTFIGGGVLRGHNITVYGRPESGKSMFAINTAAPLVKNGYKVLYVANEEPSQDITRRLLARMAGIKIKKLHRKNFLEAAFEKVEDVYDNWFLYHKAGCTYKDISRQAAKIKPDMIIVDQLKNVTIAEDNRALQLDKLARQVRELGIEHNCVTMSVTQAGQTGEGELVLGLSDVEWSNTGIPGAADLMIGVGVNKEWDAMGKRMLSVPKNKVNGRHGSFHVWVDPRYTAFMSNRRQK
jgi:KaiC/GvpD/RAD55 family RecA-like ATPase